MPEITTTTDNGFLKIYLRDSRLSDDSLVEAVGAELNTLVNQTDDKKLVINFRDVSFINSSMIGKLVQLNKRCREESIALGLCELNQNLVEVFELMQLSRIMKIFPDEESAMNMIGDDG